MVEFIANDHDKEFMQKLDQIIKVNVKNADFNQELLTREIGMSKTQLYRKLKALTGKTVHEYIRNYRLRVAHDIIIKSDHLIYEVAYEVGFSDAAYFSKSFHAYFGIWPKDIRITK
jgi:AraC-like DNA-binding protein